MRDGCAILGCLTPVDDVRDSPELHVALCRTHRDQGPRVAAAIMRPDAFRRMRSRLVAQWLVREASAARLPEAA